MSRLQRIVASLAVALVVLIGTTSALSSQALRPLQLTPSPTPDRAALVISRWSPTAPVATATALRPTTTPTPVPPTATATATPAALLPEGVAPGHAAAAAIDAHLTSLTSAGLFSGAVLVAYDGTLLVNKGYGLADRSQGLANTPQTRFRIASLTKQFTAMAVLLLYADGRLDLADPICAYIDDCPGTWQHITIQQLLNHTSGIPSYTDFLDYEPTEMLPATRDQLIARFKDQPLAFWPGNSYSYGNSGYVLLGAIIERASGQTYEQFLHDRIFAPLGMQNTGYDHNTNAIIGQAQGYTYRFELAPFLDCSTLDAAGGLYSTVEDLYRWDRALTAGTLLPPELMEEMFRPGRSGYGYGWKIASVDGRLVIGHPGLINGFATSIARYPNERLTIILLSNFQPADVVGVSAYLADLVLGG